MPKRRDSGSRRQGAARRPPSTRAIKAAAVREFRELQEWTRKQIAESLGVTEAAVGLWESGKNELSAEHCVKLANLAEGKASRFAEKFLSLAGVTKPTLQRLADRFLDSALHQEALSLFGATTKELSSALTVRKQDLAGAFSIKVPALETTQEKPTLDYLLFPQSFISNPASTRFYRIPSQYVGRGFVQGDILLIDRLQADVRELKAGALLAAAAGEGKTYSPMFGFLERAPAPVGGGTTHYMLRTMDGAPVYLGSSADGRHPEQQWIVLGRVIAWLMPEEEKTS